MITNGTATRLLIPLLLVLAACPADAAVCHYSNLMPAYFAFEAQTRRLPLQQRAAAFVDRFAPRFPGYYGNPDIFGTKDHLLKSATRFFDDTKPLRLPGFAPLTAAHFRAVADATAPAFEVAQNAFLKSFPDFTCSISVSFGNSLLHFDGNVSDDNGQKRLLFGIEMIALLHNAKDLPTLFSHELFHVYHQQVLGPLVPKDGSVTWWAMWEEGLATYVSMRMNAPASEQDVLWFPKDLVAEMKKPGAAQKAATGMLAHFDDSKDYGRWFQTGSSAPGLPPRAGYYMGLKLAEQLGRGRPLSGLAHIRPNAVKARAYAFLEAAAQSR